ncbi:MAG: hypothetical protein R2854_21850 [Caldilineaceae bacterium]
MALERGWQDEYLADLHAVYRTRIDVLDAALRGIGRACHLHQADRRLLLLAASARRSADAVAPRASRAQARNVDFRPGINFSGNAGLHNYLRLSFAFYNAARLGGRRPPPGSSTQVIAHRLSVIFHFSFDRSTHANKK